MALPALTLLGREPAERLRRALLVALLLAGVLVFATIDRADPGVHVPLLRGAGLRPRPGLRRRPAEALRDAPALAPAAAVHALGHPPRRLRRGSRRARRLPRLPGLERLHADGRAGLRPAAL